MRPLTADRRNQANKRVVWDLWQAIDQAEVVDLPTVLAGAFHEDVDWNGPQPINGLSGVSAVADGFWAPLRHSFPDLRRDTDIFLGGSTGNEQWVSGMGNLTGTFVEDWVGIPASGEPTNIHFGQFCGMQDGKIAESYLILDVVAVMRQAGFDVLPPSRGRIGGKVPGPATRDGILLDSHDPGTSQRTEDVVAAMVAGHNLYDRDRDRSDLSSMGHDGFWHPAMRWYGPTGIGTALDLEEFKAFHQSPWLNAFGDRETPMTSGRPLGLGDSEVLCEGKYAALGLWDVPFSINYDDFLGVPATGAMTTMRDFDWYRIEDGYIVENWVPMDIIDILGQLGVDVFDLLSRQVEERQAKRWFE